MRTLREHLERPGSFVVAAELVTSRGLLSGDSGRALQTKARELAANPRIDVLSITDNPGGHAMLAPDTLGSDLLSLGQEVIIHLACKDWNRNALESRGWKLGSEGFRNVLCLSGDYPVTGHRGHAAPVFDIDSVGLLDMLADMNAGMRDERKPDGALGRTDFFLGCVVTNHKRHEREVVPQYLKLTKKVTAGARFVINQIGYDTRKDDELLRWIRREALPVAALANVYVLSPAAARAFHRGAIPGVVVTDELLALVERQAAGPDRGRAFFADLAAKHVAVARGLGFAGVYVGGHMSAETFDAILDSADRYARDDWVALAREIQFPLDGEFYLFERDAATGLSSDVVSASYLESRRRRKTDLRVPVKYRFSRKLHQVAFADDAPLHPTGQAIYRAVERGPHSLGKAAHALEQAAKVPLFGCKDCGDCSLPEIAYVCPESTCAKNQRNGPCGGTRDGLCEVYDTECIWSQAYERLKAYGEEVEMLAGPVVVKDNALSGTSAWANAFLGRDHHARHPSGEPPSDELMDHVTHAVPSEHARALVRGAVDYHVHVAPDFVSRRITDIELARRCLETGQAGFGLKSHYSSTAERAQVVAAAVPGVTVLGTITLNRSVGGLNPLAVEVAAREGARVVWFPTVSSENEQDEVLKAGAHEKVPVWVAFELSLREAGLACDPVPVVDARGALLPEAHEVLDVIARHDLVLCTGHLGRDEVLALVEAAAERGVRDIVVTHPEFPSQSIAPAAQVEMAAKGALMERAFTTPYTGKVAWDSVFEATRAVGAQHTVWATDLGQNANPPVEDGLALMADAYLAAGFSDGEIRTMAVANTRRVAGLEPLIDERVDAAPEEVA